MVTSEIPSAVDWILQAEYRWGIYSEKTSKVRRYFLAVVEPDKFSKVSIPQELKELGYRCNGSGHSA